jgi:microcystin-dependent protein
MTLYKWSQTASADATADSTINWAEGQAPSSVNDSARAMMAATAKYRDDIAGAIVTGGTSNAYTVSSFEVFDTLAHLSGQMIAFTPHATNAATVTLNVDSLGAKPLRSAPGAELLAGTIIQGTPYVAVYNSSDAAFYLQGFFGNPYNIPLAGGLDYWAPVAPNSSFVFPVGQAISRTTYATLFALVGTNFGSGDGSTTFNLPDKRGRVSAALDPTGTILTSFAIPAGSNTLGAPGGAQASQLTTANMPPYTPSGSVSTSISHNANSDNQGAITSGNVGVFVPETGAASITASSSFSGNAQGGTSAPFVNVQPTIMCNYIMRII